MKFDKRLSKYYYLTAIAICLFSAYYAVKAISKAYPNEIVNVLIYLLPLSLAISFSTIVMLSLKNRRLFAERFGKIGKKTWLVLIVIILAGFLLRATTPQTHRIYFDEDIFENIAQNILNSGRAILCNMGTPTSCDEYILNKQPNSYSFVLALTYAIFGVGEAPAFWLNILIGSATVLFVFFLSYMIFRNEKVSVYSSLIFALTPLHIIWSATAASEPLMVLSVVLTIITFMFYLESRKFSILLLFGALLVFTMQTRHETLLLTMPLAVLFAMKGNPVQSLEKYGKHYLIAALFVIALLIPHFLHLEYANKDNWGSSGEKLSMQYLEYNFSTNSSFFYENTRYPLFFTIFAFLGIFYSLKNDIKSSVFLLAWLATFFTVYLFFYAGSYNSGVDAKYSLAVAAQLSIFSGMGFFFAERNLGRLPHVSLFIIISIVVAFYFFVPYVTEIWQESFEARQYHDFALRTAEGIDSSCYILTHVPSMYIVSGKKSAQNWNVNSPAKMERMLEKTDCIVYDEGFWCQIQPYKDEVCESFHKKYNLTLIDTYAVERSQHVYSMFYVQANQNRNS